MNVFCSVDFWRRYATRGGGTAQTRAKARAYGRAAANAAIDRFPPGNMASDGIHAGTTAAGWWMTGDMTPDGIHEPTTVAGRLTRGTAAPGGTGGGGRGTSHPIDAASAATAHVAQSSGQSPWVRLTPIDAASAATAHVAQSSTQSPWVRLTRSMPRQRLLNVARRFIAGIRCPSPHVA